MNSKCICFPQSTVRSESRMIRKAERNLRVIYTSKGPATRNDFVNDIVDDARNVKNHRYVWQGLKWWTRLLVYRGLG